MLLQGYGTLYAYLFFVERNTVCISADGGVYSFGVNQFGQLGIGSDQAEIGTLVIFLL